MSGNLVLGKLRRDGPTDSTSNIKAKRLKEPASNSHPGNTTLEVPGLNEPGSCTPPSVEDHHADAGKYLMKIQRSLS